MLSLSRIFYIGLPGQPIFLGFSCLKSATERRFPPARTLPLGLDMGDLIDGVAVVPAPVPKPSTLTLVAVAVCPAGAGIWRRRAAVVVDAT